MNPFSAVELLRQIVAIPSVNPALAAEDAWRGEKRLVDFLEPWFGAKGFRTERIEATPGRPNLMARFGAEEPEKTLLFESHLDTVGVAGFQGDPFALREADGKLYGRGACDTKGPLAALMAALDGETLAALAKSPVQLVWLGAIGEETGNAGAEEAVAAGLRADECVVLEPTDLRIVHAHKGVCWFTVATRGRAAHASDPARGDNAILKMPAIWRILEEEKEGAAKAFSDPVLGRPTVSVGTIHGGTGTNIVPDRCEIQVDRRLMPGETAAGVLEDLRRRLAAVPGGATVALLKEGLPFHTDADADLVQRLGLAIEAAGEMPVREGAAWCSDAGVLSAACRQTVVWGPGSIAQAHTADEYIERESLEAGRETLRRFLIGSARA
ncbi:MAG TPA: acetylornithine deacetylase [Verrucomicrobia bacterium]|nr:acetylornithine deacetylase [Verrucomicrobiota bacterium]